MPASTVLLIVCGAVLFGLIPFLPGWFELRRPRDDKPLHIDLNYQKNHFFFGDSFHALLKKGMPEALPPGHSHHRIALSKPEEVHAVSERDWQCTSSDKGLILYVDGNMQASERSAFGKEVFVAGNATIGEGSHVRAILCHGNLSLGRDSHVVRWLDVRGDSLITAASCRLGRSTACKGLLHLAIGTSFVNLHGVPIKTYSRKAEASTERSGDIGERCPVASPDSSPMRARIETNIVSRQNIRLSAECEVQGDVKSYGNVELEAGVTVHGNIVAEGDVIVGAGSRVLGNIFSQGGVVIYARSAIGAEGSVRSVVCRKMLVLHNDASIYGTVSCAQGRVA